MSDHCHGSCSSQAPVADAGYRRVLVLALLINAAMFVIEVVAGSAAGSKALLADALDFMGDAANYAISLYVLDRSLAWRARASLLKGLTMAGFGVWVLLVTVTGLMRGDVPEAATMGAVGLLALAANVGVALMLFRHRSGDSNRESVWICSRNDAIGNVAVVLAAIAVWFSGSHWPDVLVALVMATLALTGAARILRSAFGELRAQR